MDDQEFILAMFQEGLLCDCGKDPSWDRIYDENNNFICWELAHNKNCTGKLKAGEMLMEIKDVEVQPSKRSF